MAHGYMREFDEERDNTRDRSDWRNEERSGRDWRGEEDRRWREQGRDRGMMFGGDRDRHQDRGFFDRLGERARDSFRDDDRDHRHWGRDTGHGQSGRGSSAWNQDPYWSDAQDREQSWNSGWDQDRQRSSSHPDDHYRSWRDKQMQSLDRDYQDYCREREQQFHQDFDSWRQQRYGGNPGPLRTGMTQTGLSEDPSGMAEAEAANRVGTTPPDPMDTATLGTNPRNKQSGK